MSPVKLLKALRGEGAPFEMGSLASPPILLRLKKGRLQGCRNAAFRNVATLIRQAALQEAPLEKDALTGQPILFQLKRKVARLQGYGFSQCCNLTAAVCPAAARTIDCRISQIGRSGVSSLRPQHVWKCPGEKALRI